jgi:hypothetical protein
VCTSYAFPNGVVFVLEQEQATPAVWQTSFNLIEPHKQASLGRGAVSRDAVHSRNRPLHLNGPTP